ncbi:transcriptional repressor LexA [Candidatus Clostridium radicumherbarum]|uniref:Transcriptional repressor LexA n=1 Tax=Candidatus Clostridium radicumherbarum TaxID=3381662 RepID=A0ABW8TPG4_9CLOT
MQLDGIQEKIIRSKPNKLSLIKGSCNTGKTTIAVYRTLYLKNNYCLFDDDKILILAKDSRNRDQIRAMYNVIDDDTKFDYKTLFTNNVDRVDVLTVGDIINRYYFKYTNTEKKWFKVIQEEKEKTEIIRQCIDKISNQYENLRILKTAKIKFFIDEIDWIKACGYRDLDVYQNSSRIGRKCKKGEGPIRLLKNSKERAAIYEIYKTYNEILLENGLIDKLDISYLALMEAQKTFDGKYTHIIVDESESLTKTQLDFIKALFMNKNYSSLMFTINKDEALNFKAWFIKGRRIKDLKLDFAIKNYNLAKTHCNLNEDTFKEAAAAIDIREDNIGSMECFQYIDIKHHVKHIYKRDADYDKEIIALETNEEIVYSEKDLLELPVYSDIAAGEPIMMSSEVSDQFYLPEYWIKGGKQNFILKVKGDSMIGANIFDGDYVVIKKQSTAQNGDIVAADIEGSATLKTLSLGKDVPMLMPENEKYSPIFIHDKQVSILGVAVGIIKKQN